MGFQTRHPSVGNGPIETKIGIKYKLIIIASCFSNCFCLNTNLKGVWKPLKIEYCGKFGGKERGMDFKTLISDCLVIQRHYLA